MPAEGYPGQAGILVQHGPFPAAHGDDRQTAFEGLLLSVHPAVEAFLVDEAGQFADGEAVHIGDAEFTDEGEEVRFHEASLDLEAAQRVGTVQDHHFDVLLGTGTHHQAQGGDEGIGTGTDVLDVIDHHIDPLQHVGRRFPGGTVQGIHREAGFRVLAAGDMVTGVRIAPDAVLRAVQGHEVHLGRLEEDVDGGTEIPVHAGGVRYQAHPLAAEFLETIPLQHVDAGIDLGGERKARQREDQCQ